MVPTKSSLCSPLNSYSLCLCLPSVPKRRERKKPTSHALKEKLVGVFFFFWFFHHSFLAFSESQICDAWKMLLLCSNTNCYCIEKKQQPRVKTLFVCWVGRSSIYPTWVVRLLATFIVLRQNKNHFYSLLAIRKILRLCFLG